MAADCAMAGALRKGAGSGGGRGRRCPYGVVADVESLRALVAGLYRRLME